MTDTSTVRKKLKGFNRLNGLNGHVPNYAVDTVIL